MKQFAPGTWLVGALLIGLFGSRIAHAQETEAISTSQLASVTLPPETQRVLPNSVPADISNALTKVVEAGGPQVKQGRNEVLVWSPQGFKKSHIAGIKSKLSQNLKNGGWQYEEQTDPEMAPMTVVTALKTAPARKALIGFWVPTADGLLLAWTEMLPAGNSTSKSASPPSKPPVASTQNAGSAGATVIEVSGNKNNVNVMKGATPPKPAFAPLAPKKGFVRGWVKDWKGKPLQGAVIGVRSTAAGGFYSGASSKTDARGYYEIQVPWGVASFYCAGYTVDWGDEGRAALGLAPADGDAGEFASPNGAIENWVLYPYGIADRDDIADQPQYVGNYYGGGFNLYTSIGEEPTDYQLPLGSTYEVTLTPVGNLFDGSKGRTFVIRRKLDAYLSSLYVNNIPIGIYKLSAKLIYNGQVSPLKMKETGMYSSKPFGLEPKEARGETTLTFRPHGAKAEMATAAHGNWDSIDITLTP